MKALKSIFDKHMKLGCACLIVFNYNVLNCLIGTLTWTLSFLCPVFETLNTLSHKLNMMGRAYLIVCFLKRIFNIR